MPTPTPPAAPSESSSPGPAPAARKPVRPPKLSPEIQRLIVEAIRAGSPRTVAAEYAGIHRSTLFRCLQHAEQSPRSPYRQLAEDIRKGEADYNAALIATVTAAIRGNAKTPPDAKLAVRLLASRLPKEFGERHQLDLKLAGEREALLAAARETLPPDHYRALLAALVARDDSGGE